jgi:hypothetical protein
VLHRHRALDEIVPFLDLVHALEKLTAEPARMSRHPIPVSRSADRPGGGEPLPGGKRKSMHKMRKTLRGPTGCEIRVGSPTGNDAAITTVARLKSIGIELLKFNYRIQLDLTCRSQGPTARLGRGRRPRVHRHRRT